MESRPNRIIVALGLACLLVAVPTLAEQPSISILGSGFTGKPFVLGGDLVLESDSLVDLVRDYGTSPEPTLVGWYDNSGDAFWKQVVSDNGLCVALFDPNGTSVTGFSVMDASDPGALALLGTLEGMEFDSAWLRDGAVTLSSGPLLVTYDLATPAAPGFSAATMAGDGEGLRWFSCVDGTLYLVDHAATLRALSVADPRHPAPLSVVTIPGDNIDAMVAGDGVLYALVSSAGQVDLVTLDTAVAGAPVEVDRQGLFTAPDGRGRYLARDGGLLVASGTDGIVRSFGLAVAAAPQPGWTLAHAGDHLAISTSRVFVMDGSDLFIYARTPYDAPPGTPGHRAVLPRLRTVEGRGNHLISQIDEAAQRLVPIDVTDPACPHLGAPLALAQHGRLAYRDGIGVLLEGARTCRLLDFADPEHPLPLGAVTVGDSVEYFFYDLPARDLLAIVAHGTWGGVHLYDISDPWQPGPERYLPESGVRYADQHYAICGDQVELRIYDLTLPAGPSVIGTLDVAHIVSGPVIVHADHAYVTTYNHAGARDLRIFDISDPAAPATDLVMPLARSVVRKDLHGNRLYLQGYRGFDAYDLSTPSSPVLIGSYATPYNSTSGFAIDGNRSIVSSRLISVLNGGLSASPVPTPGRPGEWVRLEPAFPNPCNPSTRIAFTIDRERDLSVTVHDLRGRRVAVLASGLFGEGQHDLTWHGTDDHGAPVASGVYLVRLSGDGVEATTPVTLLK